MSTNKEQSVGTGLQSNLPLAGGEFLSSLLSGIAALPQILVKLINQEKEIQALHQAIEGLRKDVAKISAGDCWMDAKGAAKYMGISDGTFEKYRYHTNPKVKGYKLDGKTLFKKSDIDSFIVLYEVKSLAAG